VFDTPRQVQWSLLAVNVLFVLLLFFFALFLESPSTPAPSAGGPTVHVVVGDPTVWTVCFQRQRAGC
jgi:hypothetical protein